MVKYLIEETDCLIDATDFQGETALLKSMEFCDNSEIAVALISAGANVNKASVDMLTPLHVAVRKSKAVAQLLIENGANMNAIEGLNDQTPLHLAVAENNYDMVCMLLYYGADANITNEYGMTPFMYAASLDANTEILQELIKYEINVNRVDSSGYSTLLLLMNFRNPLALELIEKGADLHYTCGTIHNAANLALAYEDNAIFEQLWSMIRRGFLYDIEIDMNNIFDADIKGSVEWRQRLHLIFESDKAEIIVQKHRDVLSYLIPSCHSHGLKENDTLPIVSICLMYGAEATYKHVNDTYRLFGYNEMLKLLLHMGVRVNYCSEDLVLPYFICCITPVLSGCPSYCKLCIRIDKKENKIKCISKYITFLYTLCQSCNEFYMGRNVPSLKELARLATRRAIASRFETKDTMMFYTIVNHLNIPNVIKKLIGYEIPVI